MSNTMFDHTIDWSIFSGISIFLLASSLYFYSNPVRYTTNICLLLTEIKHFVDLLFTLSLFTYLITENNNYFVDHVWCSYKTQ